MLKVAKVFAANGGDLFDREVVCEEVRFKGADKIWKGRLVEFLDLKSPFGKVAGNPLFSALRLMGGPPVFEFAHWLGPLTGNSLWLKSSHLAR